MIALTDCIIGHVYEVNSRNLRYAVFTGDYGFLGLREKFGEHYLFTEYHWDQGPPYGTVRQVLRDLGTVPEGMSLSENATDFTVCRSCGGEVKWHGPAPGPWKHVAEPGPDCDDPDDPWPVRHQNNELFIYLRDIARSIPE